MKRKNMREDDQALRRLATLPRAEKEGIGMAEYGGA